MPKRKKGQNKPLTFWAVFDHGTTIIEFEVKGDIQIHDEHEQAMAVAAAYAQRENDCSHTGFDIFDLEDIQIKFPSEVEFVRATLGGIVFEE